MRLCLKQKTKKKQNNKNVFPIILLQIFDFFLTVNSFTNYTFPDPNLVFMFFSQKVGGLSSQPVQNFPPFSLFCWGNILREEISKIRCLLWFIFSENLVHYGWEEKTEQSRLCHDIQEGEGTSGGARGA